MPGEIDLPNGTCTDEETAYLTVLREVAETAISPWSVDEIASKCSESSLMTPYFTNLRSLARKIPAFNQKIFELEGVEYRVKIKMLFITQTPISPIYRYRLENVCKKPNGLVLDKDDKIIKLDPVNAEFGALLERETEVNGRSMLNPVPWSVNEIQDLLKFLAEKVMEDGTNVDFKTLCSQFKYQTNSERTDSQLYAKALQYIGNGINDLQGFRFEQKVGMLFFLRIPPYPSIWKELYEKVEFQIDDKQHLTFCRFAKMVFGEVEKTKPLSVPKDNFVNFLKSIARRTYPMNANELAQEFLKVFPNFDTLEGVTESFKQITCKDLNQKIAEGIELIQIYFITQIPVSQHQMASFKSYGNITYCRRKISKFVSFGRDVHLKKPRTRNPRKRIRSTKESLTTKEAPPVKVSKRTSPRPKTAASDAEDSDIEIIEPENEPKSRFNGNSSHSIHQGGPKQAGSSTRNRTQSSTLEDDSFDLAVRSDAHSDDEEIAIIEPTAKIQQNHVYRQRVQEDAVSLDGEEEEKLYDKGNDDNEEGNDGSSETKVSENAVAVKYIVKYIQEIIVGSFPRPFNLDRTVRDFIVRNVDDKEELGDVHVLDALTTFFFNITRILCAGGDWDYPCCPLHTTLVNLEKIVASFKKPMYSQLRSDIRAIRRLTAFHGYKIAHVDLKTALEILCISLQKKTGP